MGPQFSLEESRYRPPQCPTQGTRQYGQREMNGSGQSLQAHSYSNGEQCPHVELALDADVEQPTTKSQSHGQSGQSVRRGDDQSLGKVADTAHCAFEQSPVGFGHAGPRGPDDDRADCQGREYRQDRNSRFLHRA